MPYPCDDIMDFITGSNSYCTIQSVTIHNQNRELFYLNIPVELYMERVNIDSLDSILYSLSPNIS